MSPVAIILAKTPEAMDPRIAFLSHRINFGGIFIAQRNFPLKLGGIKTHKPQRQAGKKSGKRKEKNNDYVFNHKLITLI